MAQRWQRLPDKAKDRVKDEIAQQLTEQMANAIRQRFAADWPNFHMAARASATTIPTEIPQTPLGVPYHTISYLIRVREQVQRLKESRGVMPETAEEGQLLSQRQLADLPGIGQSAVYDRYRRLPFASLAVERAEPFMSEEGRSRWRCSRLRPSCTTMRGTPIFSASSRPIVRIHRRRSMRWKRKCEMIGAPMRR